MKEEVLKSKLNLLTTSLEKLVNNFPDSFEEFQKNDLVLSASERYFQLIVDAVVDCNQISHRRKQFIRRVIHISILLLFYPKTHLSPLMAQLDQLSN